MLTKRQDHETVEQHIERVRSGLELNTGLRVTIDKRDRKGLARRGYHWVCGYLPCDEHAPAIRIARTTLPAAVSAFCEAAAKLRAAGLVKGAAR